MNARAAAVTLGLAARKGAAERGALLFVAGFYVIVVGVVATLWRTAAATNGGAVAGYSAVALTWYVATAEAATVSINARLIEEIGTAIVDGTVAVEMLRPVSVLAVRVVIQVGRALPRLAACAAAGVLVSVVAAGPPPSLAALALAAPSLVLGVTCNIVAMHAFAGAGFWVRDTRSAWFLYQKLLFLLGGMLLPLEVLPHGMAAAGRVLPFTAMAYVPGRIASGHLEPHLLLVQAFWLVVLALLAGWVFAAGERRLQVVGG